jgi:GTP pyrophosphokinase
MVQVREQRYLAGDGSVDVEQLAGQLPLPCGDPRPRTPSVCARSSATLAGVRGANPGRDLDDWAHESNCELGGGRDGADSRGAARRRTDCLIAGLLYRAVREERLTLAIVEERYGKRRHVAGARCSAHGGDRGSAQSQ